MSWSLGWSLSLALLSRTLLGDWALWNSLSWSQYLQPSKEHQPVTRFVPPEEFARWREVALEIGFLEVASGPFVRSSYHAQESYQRIRHRIC